MKNKNPVGFFKGFCVHFTKESDVPAMCREMAETGASRMWALIDGTTGGWPEHGNDDIARFVDAAHRHGMEFHGSMICNMAGQAVLRRMGDCKDWAAVNKKGEDTLSKQPWGQTWCCPTSKGFRDYQLERIAAWIKDSEMDGLLLDFIRYPDTYRYENIRAFERTEVPEFSFCYCDRCRKMFKEVKGYDPMDIELVEGPRLDEWRIWRQAQITEEVREIRNHLPSRFALSAAVFPTPGIARKNVLQNWPDFSDQLDYVCTMIYTPIQWGHPIEWVKDATKEGRAELKGKCRYYAIFGFRIQDLPPGQLRRGILAAKAGGADGAMIFCYPGPSVAQTEEIKTTNEELEKNEND